MNLLTLIRYRFFLFAGLLPYFLGQAIAFDSRQKINWPYFGWGFVGIFFVLIAVELFNEYFDAEVGGDRIFSLTQPKIPPYFYKLGILASALGFAVGVYLAINTGWPVLIFAGLGFLAAYFYVGPPIRWAYRGFGETIIALSYGPFMLLGSYYIQTIRFDFVPFFVSLICGLSVFGLAVLNEIPDYYQDKLVGKQNLVVRLGKQRAVVLLKITFTAVFVLLVLGIVLRVIPFAAAAPLLTLPWLLKAVRIAEKNYDNPAAFRFTINAFVISHIAITLSLAVSFLI